MLALCVENVFCIARKCHVTRSKTTRIGEVKLNELVMYASNLNGVTAQMRNGYASPLSLCKYVFFNGVTCTLMVERVFNVITYA